MSKLMIAYWRSNPRAAATLAFCRAWLRLDNRWQDLLAVLRGACNAGTWGGVERGHAGYSHWRCAKSRGHDHPHRFHNYTWAGPGSAVQYAPLPVRNEDNTGWFDADSVLPFRTAAEGRHPISTCRRSRQLARYYEQQRRARADRGAR